jgi:hypothetical protein
LAGDSGLYSQSFGIENESRYIIVYKKEYNLTEDEIEARRNGDGWSSEVAAEYEERRKNSQIIEEETKEAEREEVKLGSKKVTKNRNMNIKMLANQAVKVNENNGRTYGMVKSENKKDLRSIEETLADIQRKKKMKIQHNPDPEAE